MENTQTISGFSDQKVAAIAVAFNKLCRLPADVRIAAAERIIGLIDGLTIAFGGAEKK